MQTSAWAGELGIHYTDRNEIDWKSHLPIWKEMLQGIPLDTVLEVGCNRGHNLKALEFLLGKQKGIVGIDLNNYALDKARANGLVVQLGDAASVPYKDNSFDLVFTRGVLIHIPLAKLPTVLSELYRVSGRYIMIVEYFADEETMVPWRKEIDLLWKRDFPRHLVQQFPNLKEIRSGKWLNELNDPICGWLYEK